MCSGFLCFQVKVQWETLPRDPPPISLSCQTYDVRPIAPDPVENLIITFQQAVPQSDVPNLSGMFNRIFITLNYTWTAPMFKGEGITGYEAWLNKEPAPENPTGILQQIDRLATSDGLRDLFDESDANFTLYFQVSWTSVHNIKLYVTLYASRLAMCMCMIACMF